MNLTHYTSQISSQVGQISPTDVPGTLWKYYLEYLVYYESDSWVARIAYICRVVAILLSLPLLILAMLDLASYGIARTLGVVDDTRASTSDKGAMPVIQIDGLSTTGGASGVEGLSQSEREALRDGGDGTNNDNNQEPPVYYAGDEQSLKLSGVGVFSPAASRPPSPTITRQQLASEKGVRRRGQNQTTQAS